MVKEINNVYLISFLVQIRGAFKKKKLRNFGHVAKRGGVSSSGKLFNEEKFGHVFRGGVKGTRPK